MLMLTMLVTGPGSAYTALAGDLTNFTISRAITGAGIGADLTAVSTYLGEVAPRDRRARTSSLIFLAANAGATAAIWLGLVLTTSAGRWPAGLPFAQAGPGFEDGWRWMYGIGAILALVAVVLHYELPESPRRLIGRGRYEQAERLVAGAESRARRRGHCSSWSPSSPRPPASPSSTCPPTAGRWRPSPPATRGDRGDPSPTA
jgi:MFS transporter, putative metabolite:H+ symporter